MGESGTVVGSERAIEDGSGAPKSLFAKASVGTEDETQHEVSNRGAVRIIMKKTRAVHAKRPHFYIKDIERKK